MVDCYQSPVMLYVARCGREEGVAGLLIYTLDTNGVFTCTILSDSLANNTSRTITRYSTVNEP
jgi:hypothetical protein